MLTDEAALFSAHGVIACSLILVRIIFGRLGVGELSDSVAGPAVFAGALLDDSIKGLHDLVNVRMARETNVVIGLVFERDDVTVLRGCLDPVNSLRVVLGNIRVGALNEKTAENITSIVCLSGLVGNNSLELGLGHLIENVKKTL